MSAIAPIVMPVSASPASIARAIGAPDAVRAVGSACGANPVAVLVPCHRVVGSDGTLTGYAGAGGADSSTVCEPSAKPTPIALNAASMRL